MVTGLRKILLPLACIYSALALGQQQSLTALYMPSAVAAGGGSGTAGSPYAVFVQIRNWTGGSNSQAYLKLYSSTNNNEYMWSATSQWSSATAYTSSNQPMVSIDAAGNWSGWIYAKHNDNLGVAVQVRAAKVGATSTNLTSSSKTLTILSMTPSGTGGWLVRSSSPAVNKGILAYSAGTIVGSYRTEDNSIAEGYSYGQGGFKIAVPSGLVDSLVTINDNGSRDQAFVGPWVVAPGQETDASVGGTLIGRGSALTEPRMLAGGKAQQIALKLYGEAPYTIRSAKLTVPPGWSWSRSLGDVSVLGGGSPVATVVDDTIGISNLNLQAADSMLVRIANLTPPDSTGTFTLPVRTGTSPDSIYPIAAQPSVSVYGTPLPISAIREADANGVPFRVNTLVTARGIVTVAGELGKVCYMQDNSGGLAVFDSAFAVQASPGDEVVVSGLLQPFRGLTEIVNPVLHAVVTSGNTVEPVVVTASQIRRDGVGGVEVFEGRLVRLNGVMVIGSGGWVGGTNYPLYDAQDTTQLRIDGNTNLPGSPIPASAFDIIGVVGQFINTSPYIGGYQLLPRSSADILATGPIIASIPVETAITATGLTIGWETLNNGTSWVKYGKTPSLEIGMKGFNTLEKIHRVRLDGLEPATIYYVRALSVAGSDTSAASPIIVSTASPSQSTGTINIYFNKSVNTALAWYQPALGQQNLLVYLLPRLRNARRSVDVALYSLSGSPGDNIAGELVAARSRGVSVRVICEYDNSNSSSFTRLRSDGVPVIDDRFDGANAGAGLMHNKFFVVDGRGGAPESTWVWTGSWNPTAPGTNDDYQNAIEIQDAALASAYTTEFNEMWGSSTDVPDATSSRFGARKTDNTPHRFVIGGRDIQCYFSPSDRTTSRIIEAINAAGHSVAFNLLTLTRQDIANALVARKQAGLAVRGAMDNNVDTGSQFNFLVANSVDVRLKTGTAGLLHHKYGIVDAENPYWGSRTITGSHNWSNSAENSNNENLLILTDGNTANQYLQEFAARYYQFGGRDTISVNVSSEKGAPSTFALQQNYPNPFNPTTKIQFTIVNTRLPHEAQHRGQGQLTIVKVYDVLGREVATLVNEVKEPGTYTAEFNASNLASGIYFYRLTAGGFVCARKMVVLK